MDAIFCGNGSLLIECADVFQRAGGRVVGILSSDLRISTWAADHALPLLGVPANVDLTGIGFDYLFSIANLVVLPAALISQARKMAINFHDGPLPDQAGLNVPAWAILNGHQSHAVTWHEMTAQVDAGLILQSRTFDILPDDTTFSLNARCYETGLESFTEVVDELRTGRMQTVAQHGARHLRSRAARPDGLGVLDFSRPATDLSNLIRGLDFGPYANPLALPKLWTGTEMVIVRTCGIVEGGANRPGHIAAVLTDSILIETAKSQLRVSGFSNLAGAKIDPATLGLHIGQMLPRCTDIPADLLTAVGKAEAIWESELTRAVPTLPPYPMLNIAAIGVISAPFALPALATTETIAAAWLAWVAGLTGQPRASVAIEGIEIHPALSSLRLVSVDLAPDMTTGALLAATAQAINTAQSHAPMTIDLSMRLADADTRENARLALTMAIADDEAPTNATLTILKSKGILQAKKSLFDEPTLIAIACDFAKFLAILTTADDQRLPDLPLAKLRPIAPPPPGPAGLLHDEIADLANRSPDAIALEVNGQTLTFADLNQRAEALAKGLANRGAGPGTIIGLCLERSADLVIGMIAILKTGAAYLPLDPAYPPDRIHYMIADSAAPLILASRTTASQLTLDPSKTIFPDAPGTGPLPAHGTADDLAYLIYTSGSTGRPKGVMIPHRAVVNFMAGMDAVVPLPHGSRLLSVTSVSFDISVLEIFWTLSRGATLVLQTDAAAPIAIPDFSLFYFASEAAGNGHHAYRLLLEGARFADENGFTAIWTPERHFHAFGGLYPNPAISSAALSGITKNVKLRGGSSVAPLHHPLRLAEDWALVDNLSNGRAGIAIASGWQPNDFVIRPDAFADRKDHMIDAVTTMRRLWKGEALPFAGPDGKLVDVRIHPLPMQTEMPLWLTAAGNPETFAAAAKLGCGVLTHLLGQNIDDLAAKIAAYRAAWVKVGHPGRGHVVLMLHSFVGTSEDQVRNAARQPMKSYLKSAVDLVKRAAWTFPTIVQRAEGAGVSPQEMFEKEELSAKDLDQLLDHAFERYYRTSGLFGTPLSARDIVRDVARIGVDEIACLIDFGIDTDLVLENLPQIKALMNGLEQDGPVTRKASVAQAILDHRITHLQCTPSMAAMLVADAAGREALSQLKVMMVGGEGFPHDLAKAVRAAMPGVLLNMYGPTETTIWSLVARLDQIGEKVAIGQPILNTVIDVRSPLGRSAPDLVAGELWIGGAGLATGYWQRPDQTAERFVETPLGRFYRTGDLVRRGADGVLEFLGRIDNQVKIRGHRIELGEIEAALASQSGVRQAVVHAVEFGPNDTRLIGYVTPNGARPEAEALRAALALTLPDFMLPSRVVILDAFPLTPNGKIDRKALPKPGAETAQTVALAGADETEAAIAAIWRDALGLDSVSVTDNFFDLGGHSLLVIQVQRRMKLVFQRDIAITDLFRFPTIRSIAAFLSIRGADATNITETAATRGAARAAARLSRMGRR